MGNGQSVADDVKVQQQQQVPLSSKNSTTSLKVKEEESQSKSRGSSSLSSSSLPKPKHLLWGCTTIEEHYKYYDNVIELISKEHSLHGLQCIQFEYRMVHGTNNNCHCCDPNNNGVLFNTGDVHETNEDDDIHLCSTDDDDDDDDDFSIGGYESDNQQEGGEKNNSRNESGIHPKEENEGGEDDDDELPQVFMVPIGTSITEHIRKSQSNLLSSDTTTTTTMEAAIVVEKERSTSMQEMIQEMEQQQKQQQIEQQQLQQDGHDSDDGDDGGGLTSKQRIDSSNSLFSLATHVSNKSSSASTTASGYSSTTTATDHPLSNCALRLFHIPSNTMITEKNYSSYIGHGIFYDEMTRLCMEYAQELMIEYGQLQWKTICNNNNNHEQYEHEQQQQQQHERTVRVLISKSTDDDNDDDESQQQQQQQSSQQQQQPTLVIVTGKGKVGAGIFSRRLLLTNGLESATALSFVRQAHQRNMRIVILDPNNTACTTTTMNAMEVFETSIDTLFFTPPTSSSSSSSSSSSATATTTLSPSPTSPPPTTTIQPPQQPYIYVLAHSMAGSQFVRYFLNKHNNHNKAATTISTTSTTTSPPPTPRTAEYYLSSFQAVAFTDSNHNINWVNRVLTSVTEFLQNSKRSIYIKSHKVHEDSKLLGELHHDCHYWKHRFGTIHTLWAGTNEHALTNHTGQFHIWDHFDQYLDP